jgi:hypothetical protein
MPSAYRYEDEGQRRDGRPLRASFVVTDIGRQKLAYVYFEDEPGRRSAAKLLLVRWRDPV